MVESSPSDIERASWINLPDVGYWQSWKNRNINPGIMDGGYMGLRGDPIFDTHEQVFKGVSGGEISVCNPGVRKVSLTLKNIFSGRALVILDISGNPDCEISFLEAANDGLLQEMTYSEVWKYLSAKTTALNPVQALLIEKRVVPETVYQVTKNGVGKIAIANRDIQRPDIVYFSGFRPRI